MATYTEHYKLQKPSKTEKYNIDVDNTNMDKIDAALHQLDLKEITKEDIGLGNVENKSSSTIRSEITKSNVTTALGYTPYTPNEIDNKFSTLETKIDWKESVETFDDISSTYPNPEDGWTVNTKDTDYTYRFNGEEWVVISANAIPKATDNVDGLLSKEDHIKYEDANSKKHEHDNKSVLDKLAESGNGNLLYDGEEIGSGINDDHTHGYMKIITLSTTEPTTVSDGEIVMVYEE